MSENMNNLLPTGSEEREVFGGGSIPVAMQYFPLAGI